MRHRFGNVGAGNVGAGARWCLAAAASTLVFGFGVGLVTSVAPASAAPAAAHASVSAASSRPSFAVAPMSSAAGGATGGAASSTPASSRSGRAAATYQVNLGYADTARPNPVNFPTPWNGAPNVVFEGCTGSCQFDSGAVEVVNTSSKAITVDSVVVTFDTCVYDIWPHSVALPAKGELIVTQTASGTAGGCTPGQGLMDSSDIGLGGADWAGNCTQSGLVPQVAVSVNGTATTYQDTGKVLNTGGVDGASCNPKTTNESEQWTPIGNTPCGGLVLTVSPSVQALAPGAQASASSTVKNGCGNALSGVPVNFDVTSGPNSGVTGSPVTGANGKATFTYTSTAQGIDDVVASVTNPAGSITAAPVLVEWETATLTLSTGNALPGANVTFTGTGYADGESVTLHENSTSGPALKTVTASGTGTISGSFVVPVPSGTVINAVVALGATSAKQGWAPLSSGCTDDWVSPVSGNWNTASAWSTGAVPGGSDEACIIAPGRYTVTMNNNDTVNSLIVGGATGAQTLDVQAAGPGTVQLTTTSGIAIHKTGVFSLDSLDADNYSMVNGGTITNDGTLSTVQGAGSTRYLRASIVNNADGTLLIGGADTRFDQSNTLTNNGTFTVSPGASLSIACNGTTVVNQAAGTVTNNGTLYMDCGSWNQSGGTLTGNPVVLQAVTLTDSAGTGALTLQCTNTLAGTVPSGQTVTVLANGCGSAQTNLSGTVTNDGTLSLDSLGGSISAMINGGTLVNDGTFSTVQDAGSTRYLRSNITNNGTVSIGSASTVFDQTYTLTNNGTFGVSAGAGLSISCNGGTVFDQTAGTVTNNGSLYMDCGSWNQSGGTLTGNPVVLQAVTLTDSAGTGALTLQCTNTLAGTVPSGQTVTVLGNGCGNAQANLSGTVTNDGTLILDSADPTQWSMINGGTLVNDGTFSTLQDAGETRYLRSNITNNGTVSIGSADTRADQTYTLTNNGTFGVSAGAGLSISCNGGTVFDQTAGTVTNGGSLYMNCGSWDQAGGTLTGNPVVLQAVTLTDSAGTGAFTLQCTNTLAGTVPSGQTVTVLANGCGNAATNLSGTVTNAGTLSLDSLDADAYSLLGQAGGGGSLTNNGTLSIVAGNGNIRYLRASITNGTHGKMNVTAGDTRMDSGNILTNNGKVSIMNGGHIAFSAGSTYGMASTATLGVTVVAASGVGFGLSGPGITVAGALAVTAVGAPTSGQSFPVITTSVTGTFASVTAGYTASYASGVSVTKT